MRSSKIVKDSRGSSQPSSSSSNDADPTPNSSTCDPDEDSIGINGGCADVGDRSFSTILKQWTRVSQFEEDCNARVYDRGPENSLAGAMVSILRRRIFV